MVSRGGLSFSRHGIYSLVLTAVVLFISQMFFMPLQAQPSSNIRVMIGNADWVPLGDSAIIPVTIEHNLMFPELVGFELDVAYEEAPLDFSGAIEGDLLTDCGWEYFEYRKLGDGLIRLTAIADILNSTNPTCNLIQNSGNLAYLVFHVTTDNQWECHTSPVKFKWLDCASNSFVNGGGDTIVYSDRVYSHNWHFGVYEEIQQDDEFPTSFGTPDSCMGLGGNVTIRLADFVNGYVDILCSDTISNRGDLNLNQIANEVADWVIYSAYFLLGLNAFTLDVEAQTAASDINADGLTLTMRDFIYQLRIIIGDVPPIPKRFSAPGSDTAIFIQDLSANTVILNYPDSLAGAHLVFSGDVDPDQDYAGPDNTPISAEFQYDTTRVLIAPDFATPPEESMISFGAGQLFSYTGDGYLLSVDVADYTDKSIPVKIEYVGIEYICGDVNDDHEVDVGDIVYLIAYIFSNASEPNPYESGDVNCDMTINLLDVVYLVSYVFRDGPIPCADCR
ncbi:MAG: hypothetical protein GF404_04075 [candidate division Zixibacteria bacterium]|nr:hypothetical protein [candidate division Zixibacteria bacterium]